MEERLIVRITMLETHAILYAFSIAMRAQALSIPEVGLSKKSNEGLPLLRPCHAPSLSWMTAIQSKLQNELFSFPFSEHG